MMLSVRQPMQATGNGSVRSKDKVHALVRSTLLAQHTPEALLNAAAGAATEALMCVTPDRVQHHASTCS